MSRSGLADSPFFTKPQQKETTAPLLKGPSSEERPDKAEDRTEKLQVEKQPGSRDTVTPRDYDTTVSRYHDTIIELVRRAVKKFGKEAATHRFTMEEKKAIAGIIYSYKNGGIRTSENEITRIAVNFIVNEYRENGKNSVLDKALRALNG